MRSDVNTAKVPEPSTVILFGFGLVELAGFGRRRFKGFENYLNTNHLSLKATEALNRIYHLATFWAVDYTALIKNLST